MQLKQSARIAAQADADYGVAQQDLALRVSTRYFDVLAAQDNVQAQQASLDAISRQLEQADKRFEVGLIAITDVQEARAARDTAAADLIAAKRQLATAQEFLREITDMQYQVLATPRGTMPLAVPEPADPQKWVEASMEQNLALTSSRLGAEIARDNVRTRVRRPPADSRSGGRQVAQRERRHRRSSRRFPGVFDGGSAPSSSGKRHRQVDLPAGDRAHLGERRHAVARAPAVVPLAGRQAAPRARVARNRAHRARCLSRRHVGNLARAGAQAGAGIFRDRARAPPKRATTSARAPRSTCSPRASSWSRAQTDYSRSRYDYMLNVLRLKQSAGILDRKALEDVNGWLETPPPPANPPVVDAARAVTS